MTSSLRMAVLATLTAIIVSSAPTSAAPRIHCENAKDCPAGDICSIRPHHKTGFCVAVKAKKTHQLVCDIDADCGLGGFCKIKPGHKSGVCASPKNPS